MEHEFMREMILGYYKAYYKKHKGVFASDIAFPYGFDLREVVKIIDELLEEGVIAEMYKLEDCKNETH